MPATTLDILLSFLPVVLLIVLPLLSNVRMAAIVTLAATTVLYFMWQAPVAFYFATLAASLVSTVNILMIVFGAVFLFEMMQAAGYIDQINASVKEIHPAPEVRFFLVAIGLTCFFEGVAGFGTPGAIVPLLLISMGFKPLLSVAAVLLFDGIFAAFGAVGTPLLAGLKLPLNLDDAVIAHTAVYTAWMLLAAGIVVLGFIFRMYIREEQKPEATGTVLFLFAAAIIPFVAFSYVLPEFTTILAAVTMLLVSVLYVTKGRPKLDIKPWLPYLALVGLLLLPKIIGPLGRALDWQLHWDALFSTTVTASLKPLKSPLIPFVLIALLFTGSKTSFRQPLVSAARKLVAVALLLFPIIAVAQLMLTSGVNRPSMITVIAEAFSYSGQAYLVLAPFIGIIGAFITGSTTLSNIVFGASHQQTAQLLALDPALVFAGQLAGASIGNAICLFNIIAACSVANVKETNKVLLKNLLPALAAGFLVGLLAWMFNEIG